MHVINFGDEFGPEKIIEVHNQAVGLNAVLVLDNLSRGPGKGGIRMTPTVDVREVFRLARTMTWKTALADLPFGGAKSGIQADPKKITLEKKKELIQAFAKALKPVCPKEYIAAPDVNTAEEEMKWFVEANGDWRAATGKPADMCMKLFGKKGEKCGIPHEYGSTGFGVAQATAVAAKHMKMNIKGATVVIEGFGNVGTFAFQNLQSMGAKIVAISDSKGCLYTSNGLDYDKIADVKKKTGSVINYKEGQSLSNESLFELDVDILIPAALPDVINRNNVNKVKAKIVVEASNIPTTPDMESILHQRGILVVPDIVANAGGVISSYAEYVGKNPRQMFRLVEKKIRTNVKTVLDKAKKKNLPPRKAALVIAKERVLKAMEKRK